jgi:hypothetical protein
LVGNSARADSWNRSRKSVSANYERVGATYRAVVGEYNNGGASENTRAPTAPRTRLLAKVVGAVGR